MAVLLLKAFSYQLSADSFDDQKSNSAMAPARA